MAKRGRPKSKDASVADLKRILKNRGVRGYSGLKKKQLQKLVNDTASGYNESAYAKARVVPLTRPTPSSRRMKVRSMRNSTLPKSEIKNYFNNRGLQVSAEAYPEIQRALFTADRNILADIHNLVKSKKKKRVMSDHVKLALA